MNREECLNSAKECVTKDRQNTYGSPEDNFKRIAKLWNSYLNEVVVNEVDVAVMLALLKVARIGSGNAHPDNWIDLAGYAACGCELQTSKGE